MIGLSSLAHVHRITTMVAGRPCEVFVFDHHRSAFTLWALAAQQLGKPLTLVTLDRHMDLERPATPPPALPAAAEVLDGYARFGLAPRNDDHIVAAMEGGAIGDALIVARSHQPASLTAFGPYRDSAGRTHQCTFTRSVELAGPEALETVRAADAIALDVDLDCFTTLSDGHSDEVLAWDAELIEAFLRPPDSEALWASVLERTCVITIAREPYHCGGFGRSAALWLAFAEVFFGRLLGVPSP